MADVKRMANTYKRSGLERHVTIQLDPFRVQTYYSVFFSSNCSTLSNSVILFLAARAVLLYAKDNDEALHYK
jgi:hypothetical protein